MANDVSLLDYVAKRLGQGVTQIGSAYAGFGQGLAGKLGLPQIQETLGQGQKYLEDKSNQLAQEAGPYQTLYQGDQSLASKAKRGELEFGDFTTALSDLALTQAPQLALSMGAGKLGAMLGGASKTGQVLAPLATSTAAMAAQETGSIYNDQETPDFNKALLTGIPAGALEAAGSMYALKKSGLGKFVSEALAPAESRTMGQIAKDIGKSALGEAATEYAQTGLEQIGAREGRNWVEDVKNLNQEEMIEAGLAGGIMGGGMTTITAPLTNRIAKLNEAAEQGRQEAKAELDAATNGIVSKAGEDVVTGKQPVSVIPNAPTLEESLRGQEVATMVSDVEAQAAEQISTIDQAEDEEVSKHLPPVVLAAAQESGERPSVFHQVVDTLFQGAQNFQEFSAGLINEFGLGIKRHALKLYNTYSNQGDAFPLEKKPLPTLTDVQKQKYLANPAALKTFANQYGLDEEQARNFLSGKAQANTKNVMAPREEPADDELKARADALARGEEGELLGEEGQWDVGEYKGVKTVFRDFLVTKKGGLGVAQMIHARNGEPNEIRIDRRRAVEAYNNKSWMHKHKLHDGSSTEFTMPENAFPTEKDFIRFVLEHEFAHVANKKAENENYGQYEDRINRIAYEEYLAQQYYGVDYLKGETTPKNQQEKFISNNAQPKQHKMSYKMPSSENIWGEDTSTLNEVKSGRRTATTRSFKLGEIGEKVQFEGQPETYEIIGHEQITPQKAADPEFVKAWSKREGWTPEYFYKVYNKSSTVKDGAYQTIFKKVENNKSGINNNIVERFDKLSADIEDESKTHHSSSDNYFREFANALKNNNKLRYQVGDKIFTTDISDDVLDVVASIYEHNFKGWEEINKHEEHSDEWREAMKKTPHAGAINELYRSLIMLAEAKRDKKFGKIETAKDGQEIPEASIPLFGNQKEGETYNNIALCHGTSESINAMLQKAGMPHMVVSMAQADFSGKFTNKTGDHKSALTKINGKLYLLDQPQHEFLKPLNPPVANSGKIVSKNFKPRLIEVTEENLEKNYRLSKDESKKIVEWITSQSKNISNSITTEREAIDNFVSRIKNEYGITLGSKKEVVATPTLEKTSPVKTGVEQPVATGNRVTLSPNIQRNDLRKNPDVKYLFGDNEQRKGMGGQAASMRGEPNAIGVRTKFSPTTNQAAYWSDKELDKNKKMIDEDLAPAFDHVRKGGRLVIPKDGLGTGLSDLKNKAPLTLKYLNSRLNELYRLGNVKTEQKKAIPSTTETHGVKKIISGGQSGADMAGLEVAKELGIPTGGTAAASWSYYDETGRNKDEKGRYLRNKDILAPYGLVEGEWEPEVKDETGKRIKAPNPYTRRTAKNVEDADGTILFGNTKSPGSIVTINAAKAKANRELDKKLADFEKTTKIKLEAIDRKYQGLVSYKKEVSDYLAKNKGKLDKKMEKQGIKELQDLGKSIASLLKEKAKIKAEYQEQREAIADSHEAKLLINPTADEIKTWIKKHKIQTLNIAGNREFTNKGINANVKKILREVFKAKSQQEEAKKLSAEEKHKLEVVLEAIEPKSITEDERRFVHNKRLEENIDYHKTGTEPVDAEPDFKRAKLLSPKLASQIRGWAKDNDISVNDKSTKELIKLYFESKKSERVDSIDAVIDEIYRTSEVSPEDEVEVDIDALFNESEIPEALQAIQEVGEEDAGLATTEGEEQSKDFDRRFLRESFFELSEQEQKALELLYGLFGTQKYSPKEATSVFFGYDAEQIPPKHYVDMFMDTAKSAMEQLRRKIDVAREAYYAENKPSKTTDSGNAGRNSNLSRTMTAKEKAALQRLIDDRKETEDEIKDRKNKLYRMFYVEKTSEKIKFERDFPLVNGNIEAFYETVFKIASEKTKQGEAAKISAELIASKMAGDSKFNALTVDQKIALVKKMLDLTFIPTTFDYYAYKQDLNSEISYVAENIDNTKTEGGEYQQDTGKDDRADNGVQYYQPETPDQRSGHQKTLNIFTDKNGNESITYWDNRNDIKHILEMSLEDNIRAEAALTLGFTNVKEFNDTLEDEYIHLGKKSTNADIEFYRKLNVLKALLAKKAWNETKIVDPDIFKEISEQNADLGLTAVDIHDIYYQKHGNFVLLQNELVKIRQEREFRSAQAIFNGIAKAVANQDTVGATKLVREYVTNGLTDSQKKAYDKYYRTGENSGLDTLTRLRFSAIKSAEIGYLDKIYRNEKDLPRQKREEREAKKLYAESLATALAENYIRPNLADYYHTVELGKMDEFEQRLSSQVESIGKLNNPIVQKFYELVAKIFGADLVVIADDNYGSRYIGRANGRSKIVINVKSKTSFHRVFAHELFHHIVNKANPNAYRKFKDELRKLNPDGFDARVNSTMTRYGYARDVAEEEVMAEVYASVMFDRNFYTSLSKSFDGKILSGRLLSRLIDNVNKVLDLLHSEKDSSSYENNLILNSNDMNKVYDLITDLILSGGKPKHMGERFYSPSDAAAEINGYLKKPKEWAQKEWKEILPEGSKSRKEVMNGVERFLNKILGWIKNNVTKGVFAHFMVDPQEMKIVHKIAYLKNFEQAKANAEIVQKNLDAFKGMSTEKLQSLHDHFVRGIFDTGEVDSEGFPVYEYGQPIDVNNAEDVARAKALGYSDAVINTFKEYNKVANELYQKLLKVYPDLPILPTHYGQSIKWQSNGTLLDKDFDWVVNPEASKLEGRKQYIKNKSLKATTQEIRDRYDLSYQTINPHMLFLQYVADVNQLLALHDAVKDGLTTSGKLKKPIARIFPDHIEAAQNGYVPVDDNALKVFAKMNLKTGWSVEVMGQPYQEDDQTVVYSTEQEAIEAAQRIKRTYSKEGIDIDANPVELSNSKQKQTSHFEIRKVTKEIGKPDLIEKVQGTGTYRNQEDMKEVLARLNASAELGVEYKASPVFATQATPGQISQVYFLKDTARLINLLLAPDPIRSTRWGRRVMDVKNMQTSVEFAFSAFHALTITQEAVASYASWYNLKNKGKRSLGGRMLGGFNFRNMLNESREIAALLEGTLSNPELRDNEKANARLAELLHVDSADALDLVKQYYLVGGLLGQDSSLRSHVHDLGTGMHYTNTPDMIKIINGEPIFQQAKVRDLINAKVISKSFADVREEVLKDEPNGHAKATWRQFKMGALEASTAWLMEYGIPRVKMAMWVREYTLGLERNKAKLEANLISKEKIAHEAMLFIEDRFGEVNWQNNWMKPAYKTALQFAFRSFTWFTGSWKAFAKAGIDIGKAGWFKLKGEEYEITEQGWWAFNAVMAHLMTSALIYTAYYAVVAGTGEEVPDDEETPLLTKLIFPRVDRFDPEARVTIPSYITEGYKIMRHTGMIGNEPEFLKLISGRFNSMIGRTIESIEGRDWRGVGISNPDDSAPTKAIKSVWHILAVPPISFSTAYNNWRQKGFYAEVPMGLAAFGLTDAPAAAKRSDAENLAFHIRRSERSGFTTKPQDMELKDEVKRAIYAFQNGDSSQIDEMVKEGRISRGQLKDALSKIPMIGGRPNAKFETRLKQAIDGLTIEGALRVWDVMSDNQKSKYRSQLIKKYTNMNARQDKSREQKQDIKNKMFELGVLR